MSGVPGLVTLIRLVLSLVVLLLPTTLMGATLPLVVKSALNRDPVIGPVLTDDRRLTETSSPPNRIGQSTCLQFMATCGVTC